VSAIDSGVSASDRPDSCDTLSADSDGASAVDLSLHDDNTGNAAFPLAVLLSVFISCWANSMSVLKFFISGAPAFP